MFNWLPYDAMSSFDACRILMPIIVYPFCYKLSLIDMSTRTYLGYVGLFSQMYLCLVTFECIWLCNVDKILVHNIIYPSDNLVLSTELIMWIGHRKGIWKLNFCSKVLRLCVLPWCREWPQTVIYCLEWLGRFDWPEKLKAQQSLWATYGSLPTFPTSRKHGKPQISTIFIPLIYSVVFKVSRHQPIAFCM